MIKEVLEKGGYEVVTANDGKDAVEILGRHNMSFDLIVSDIEMPRLNGFQLAASVRKTPAIARIPMLAVSSRADRKYIQEGTEAGFDAYLEKFKPAELLSAVGELTRNCRGAA
jgi:CheY-like chemotaxis protein